MTGILVAAIPSPPTDVLHVGPLMLRLYGLFFFLGVLAAVAVTARRWRTAGGTSDVVFEVAVWSVGGGIVGARLYYLATNWGQVPDVWWGPFAIWQGGLGSFGGLAGGVLAGALMLRRRGVSVLRFADAAVPGLLLGLGIGRIGCYFAQECFGKPTDLPWAVEIGAGHRPPGYLLSTTFHPTYFYEFLWNATLAFALLWLGRRLTLRPGGLFALALAGYFLGRMLEELLRIDPGPHVLGLRLNFYVSALLFLAAGSSLLWGEHTRPKRLTDCTAPKSAGKHRRL